MPRCPPDVGPDNSGKVSTEHKQNTWVGEAVLWQLWFRKFHQFTMDLFVNFENSFDVINEDVTDKLKKLAKGLYCDVNVWFVEKINFIVSGINDGNMQIAEVITIFKYVHIDRRKLFNSSFFNDLGTF